MLGTLPEEVPLHSSMDTMAVVFRAHALERFGRLGDATAGLSKQMAQVGGGRTVEAVLGSMPTHLRLCAQSIDAARAEARKVLGARAASQSGGMVLGIVLLGISVFVAGVLVSVVLDASGGMRPSGLGSPLCWFQSSSARSVWR